jgi:hypothetical protein
MPLFLLADVDRGEGRENKIGRVGSMVASMSELTILPAVDPSVASYGMVGLGGGRTPQSAPAVRSRSGFSGAFSVSSGLTDVPSLWLAPAFGAGDDFFGGGSWHPSTDTNTMGKSKSCPLVLHDKTEALCFGLVGLRRFCRSSDCKIKAHDTKMKMGCDSGWSIAMKSQVLTGKPAVFLTPFLDSSKITEDTLCVLRDPLTRKMMVELELFILDA